MSNNYVLGAGKIRFDRLDSADLPTGERYVGNTPGFSVAAASETLDHYGDDTALRQLDKQALLQIDRESTIEIDNIDMDNMADFVIGTKTTRSQSAATVTDELVSHPTAGVVKGRTYQLGVTGSDPTGVRNVTGVAVKAFSGTPTYVLNTDYTLDAVHGTVTILTTGAIPAGEKIKVTYTTTAQTREHVEAATAPIYVAIRYEADNREGVNRDFYAPKALLAPDGDFALKGQEWGKMRFKAKFQIRGSLSPIYIDGVSA